MTVSFDYTLWAILYITSVTAHQILKCYPVSGSILLSHLYHIIVKERNLDKIRLGSAPSGYKRTLFYSLAQGVPIVYTFINLKN